MKNKNFFGVNINIILFGIVSLLNDFSSEMITPILPLFIQKLGGTGVIIGLIGGLRESLANILKVISGYFSDKTGKRKIFVFSGYFTSTAFKLFLALSKTWQQLFIFSGLERVGKGLRDAPRDAMISGYTPEKKGKAFGFHRSMDTMGAILGSITVFLLFWILELDFNTIILISAIIAIFSLVPLYYVKEEKIAKQNIALKISFKDFSRKLKLFLLISGMFALANFSYMFFILKAQKLFENKLAVGVPIFLYIIFNIFYAGFAIPLGILSDKIGRRKVIVSGYLLFCLTCLGFVFFNSLFTFIFLFISYGIVYAMVEGNQRAYIADLSSGHFRATALGLFYTIRGYSSFFSSLIAGLLWEKVSVQATFIYGSIISFLAVLLFFIFKKDLT